MTKYVISAIAGTYALIALAFTVSYTWQNAAYSHPVTLLSSAFEHGYTWPVWLFDLGPLA